MVQLRRATVSDIDVVAVEELELFWKKQGCR
jgi:hypothetical protein